MSDALAVLAIVIVFLLCVAITYRDIQKGTRQ
jgi:cbb3-type cytochrome oxidase subunit 3